MPTAKVPLTKEAFAEWLQLNRNTPVRYSSVSQAIEAWLISATGVKHVIRNGVVTDDKCQYKLTQWASSLILAQCGTPGINDGRPWRFASIDWMLMSLAASPAAQVAPPATANTATQERTPGRAVAVPTNKRRAGIDLSHDQKATFDQIIASNRHFFITGKAGSGKSVLLQHLRSHSRKRLVVAAPTGLSAINVGGQTINSLFGIRPRFIAPESQEPNKRVTSLLRKVDSIVIDEVSMVRADLFDAIDHRMRQARGDSAPFGGAQMIMFGDPYQLPPVVRQEERAVIEKYYTGRYFFHSNVWTRMNCRIIELTSNFRQSDQTFLAVLNSIRSGSATYDELAALNRRVGAAPDHVVTLATTNAMVDAINHRHLDALDDRELTYDAVIHGEFDESYRPAQTALRLKVGAQVMFLRNDIERHWVNGTIGIVSSLSENAIEVAIEGTGYRVEKEIWENIRYRFNAETDRIDEQVVGSFTQFPLRLAWAMTIHKAQGKTIDAACIDLGLGAFECGQTYVALSRCRTLDGLYLKRKLLSRDIMIDSEVIEFMSHAERT